VQQEAVMLRYCQWKISIFTKEGKFPDIHIGDNKAMQERGIGCATSQDAQIRSKINPVKQILKSKNHK
jgi:hypothetical protein